MVNLENLHLGNFLNFFLKNGEGWIFFLKKGWVGSKPPTFFLNYHRVANLNIELHMDVFFKSYSCSSHMINSDIKYLLALLVFKRIHFDICLLES